MIYYNPDDEQIDSEDLIFDIRNALKTIDDYMERNLVLPNYPIGSEQAIDIIQQRRGLEQLKEYIVRNRYKASIVHLIDDYICHMNNMVAKSKPGSEVRRFYRNMRDAADEIAGCFL